MRKRKPPPQLGGPPSAEPNAYNVIDTRKETMFATK
jgi:hypothetical protein